MTKQDAIEIIKMAIAQIEWEYPMDYAAAFDMAIEALNEPEIIRCKDCIWFHKPDAETKKSCKCNYHGCVTKGNRYCWWGEKDA